MADDSGELPPVVTGDDVDATEDSGPVTGSKRERDPEDTEGGDAKRYAASGNDDATEAAALAEGGDETADAPAASAPTAGSEEVEDTMVVRVPDDCVGKLIGKGGDTIKFLQELSHCHMDVAPQCEPGETERVITVRGLPTHLTYAKSLILHKCDPTSDAQKLPMPEDGQAGLADPKQAVETRIIQVPNDMVGRIIGKSGSTIRQMQDLSGAHIDVAKECRPGVYDREVTLTGTGYQCDKCADFIKMKLEGETLPVPQLPGYGQQELIVYIPNEQVGRVIGKGGLTIREIQDQSGAHMDIAKECQPGTDQREVTIKGDQNSIQMCQQLLMMKIQGDGVPGMGGMGGMGGGMGGMGGGMGGMGGGMGGGYGQQANPMAAYYQQYQQQQQQQQQYGQQQPQSQQVDPAQAYQYAQYYRAQAAAGDPNAAAYAQYYEQIAQSAGQQQQQQQPMTQGRQGGTSGGGDKATMVVPNDLVGRLIGKAGSTIKQLQDQSGAHVDIPQDTGAATREITISGTQAAIGIAQNLIQQKLASRF